MLRITQRLFFFSSRRRHTRCGRDWSSDVCSSDLGRAASLGRPLARLCFRPVRGTPRVLAIRRTKENAVTKIVFSPPLPTPIMDIARAMLPPGYELEVLDRRSPAFLDEMKDAEYWMGFARGGMDDEFFRAAPSLRLVQLISAGYDRIDIEAARKAGVPIANNGGSNSVPLAEHTLMLMLTGLKRLPLLHRHVVAGNWP